MVSFRTNSDLCYDLILNGNAVSTLDMTMDEAESLVSSINSFIDESVEGGNIIELVNDGDVVVVNIWSDSRYDDLVDSVNFGLIL